MQIIKNKTITEDNWRFIGDDAALGQGDICVNLSRWQRDKAELLGLAGKHGVRIGPADEVTELAGDLSYLQLIELDFPEFADGRLFSNAWLLRSRYGFKGELRATGHFMADQVFYLSRVGVDAFKPIDVGQLPKVLENLNDFTVNYQQSVQN